MESCTSVRLTTVLGVADPVSNFGTIWSLFLIALCGCSKPLQSPPADFSQRVVTADRIVVTNRFRTFGTTITGAEVSQVTKAVAFAKQNRLPAAAVYDWDVAFYAGTNYLSAIHLQGSGFLIGDAEYTDHTEVLNKFWEKLTREADTR